MLVKTDHNKILFHLETKTEIEISECRFISTTLELRLFAKLYLDSYKYTKFTKNESSSHILQDS